MSDFRKKGESIKMKAMGLSLGLVTGGVLFVAYHVHATELYNHQHGVPITSYGDEKIIPIIVPEDTCNRMINRGEEAITYPGNGNGVCDIKVFEVKGEDYIISKSFVPVFSEEERKISLEETAQFFITPEMLDIINDELNSFYSDERVLDLNNYKNIDIERKYFTGFDSEGEISSDFLNIDKKNSDVLNIIFPNPKVLKILLENNMISINESDKFNLSSAEMKFLRAYYGSTNDDLEEKDGINVSPYVPLNDQDIEKLVNGSFIEERLKLYVDYEKNEEVKKLIKNYK